MDTLKATFDDERHHLENRIKQLQQQLEELQAAQHNDIIKIDQLSSKLREQDRKHQYEVEELRHNKEMYEKKNNVVGVHGNSADSDFAFQLGMFLVSFDSMRI